MIDLTATTGQLTTLLDGVRDDQLTAATPCQHYSVETVLTHLMGLSLAFAQGARKESTALTAHGPDPANEELDPRWRGVLPTRLADLAASWLPPTAWEGDTTVGGITFSASDAGMVALNEIAVHGWDLARATGQDWRLDEDVAAELITFWEPGADDQQAREGMFAPVVPVSNEAPPLDRLLGLTGRDPHWTALPARFPRALPQPETHRVSEIRHIIGGNFVTLGYLGDCK